MRHLPLLLIAALCLPCAASTQDTPATLEQALQAQDGDSHGDLRAVVVLREGAIVAERYYNGETADALHDIRSAGKSITALLLGAAVARGQLSTTKTAGEYWPEVAGSPAGNGGNKIYVIPARRMVISIASSAYGKGCGRRRSEDILKAILKADATQM